MTAKAPTQRLPNSKEPIIKGTNPVTIWDNEDLNLSKVGQFIKIFIAFTLKFRDNIGMIKKAALLSLVLTSGCAVQTPYGPQYTRVGPFDVGIQAPPVVTEIVQTPGGYVDEQVSGFATSMLGQNISDPFILASNVNAILRSTMGPNNVSQAIGEGMTWYQRGLGFLNNPLQTAFLYTTPWVKQ